MSSEFDRFHLYSGIIRRLLLFTGLWPTPNPTTLYRLVFLFNSSVSFLTCCALFNFCYHHVAQLHLFLKGLGLALSFLTILQKVKTTAKSFFIIVLFESFESIAPSSEGYFFFSNGALINHSLDCADFGKVFFFFCFFRKISDELCEFFFTKKLQHSNKKSCQLESFSNSSYRNF